MGERERRAREACSSSPRRAHRRLRGEGGYAMAALLVGMAVMAVVMTMAMPVWSTAAKRVKEDELVFRGEQYAHAIALYQRKYANALPPNIDVLVNERFLRKKYLDPMTGQEFQALTGAVGQGAPGAGAGGRGAAATGRQGASGSTGRGLNELASATGGLGPGRSTSASGGFQMGTPSTSGATSFQTGTTGRGGTGIGAGTAGQTGSPFGGAGGIVGVASKSKEKSLRLYNGRDVYNEWAFVPVQRQLQAGGAGSAAPGLPGARGQAAPGQPNQGPRGTGSGTSPFGR